MVAENYTPKPDPAEVSRQADIPEYNNSKNRTYELGLNRFADLTNEEYRAIFLGTRSGARRRLVKSKNASQRYGSRANEHLPESVDWRKKGAVAPIKDQ
uniref:Germination-specific cysteine protease 1-like n=1 Tax=Nicotiana sylvestris TaxID=4096 RepID=A0A1U7X902_NICSY|nr:PREDICTED: germination-specific cysteine protease 1-like [Nicotiana sylvestris]